MADVEELEVEQNVSLHRLATAVENSNEDGIDFWKDLLEESKSTFQNSLSSVQNTRDRAIELIKIDLVLGSFYVALFRFGSSSFDFPSNPYILSLPFIILLSSMFIFLIAYFTLGSRTIGASSGNVYQAISEEFGQLQFCQTMAIMYAKWTDKNMKTHRKGVKLVTVGVGVIFASLGTVAGIFAFV
ncbi:hypothetical protein [Natrinema salaciae]|uniref:hypothetical protein n=1 Tax=Natrinema salaciae TaxID=1186196 RepID=UPI0011136CE2|nr:hypothetical protein [Natrinema salaciae]